MSENADLKALAICQNAAAFGRQMDTETCPVVFVCDECYDAVSLALNRASLSLASAAEAYTAALLASHVPERFKDHEST